MPTLEQRVARLEAKVLELKKEQGLNLGIIRDASKDSVDLENVLAKLRELREGTDA
jgi:hypothetical protein